MLELLTQFLSTLLHTENLPDPLLDPRQFIAIGIILLVGWLMQPLLRRIFKPLAIRVLDGRPAQHWAPNVLHQIGQPVIWLLLTQLAVEIGGLLGHNVFWLEKASRAFGFLLIYRVIVALVALDLPPDKAQFWRRRVLRPVLIVLITFEVLGLLEAILNWGVAVPGLNLHITVGSVLVAIGILVGFVLAARWLQRMLRGSFFPQAGIEPGIANIIAGSVGYSIITLGVLAGLSSMGINLTTLTVVAGGLSVGLAFGLQEIFNNLISGVIIMFERSLEPGHVIEVDGHTGEVQKISIRSTTIKTRDNVELIIPNSYFLTQVVTNMTRSEDLIRTRIDVGVSYNSNPRQVEQILLAVATGHRDVLQQPPPSVQFRNFGESSLDFTLFLWTEQALQSPMLTSQLRYDIWDALAQHNIEIPFPQRDVHIRSGGK